MLVATVVFSFMCFTDILIRYVSLSIAVDPAVQSIRDLVKANRKLF